MNGASLGMRQNNEDESRPSKRQKVEQGQSRTFVERGSVHEYRRLQESV